MDPGEFKLTRVPSRHHIRAELHQTSEFDSIEDQHREQRLFGLGGRSEPDAQVEVSHAPEARQTDQWVRQTSATETKRAAGFCGVTGLQSRLKNAIVMLIFAFIEFI